MVIWFTTNEVGEKVFVPNEIVDFFADGTAL
jgi:hypothetical protein